MLPSELLNQASEIRIKHELIADLTGERFNVFGILGLESYENSTHSAFLCELLNPRGSHGMRDAFLQAFLRMLREKLSQGTRIITDGQSGTQFDKLALLEASAFETAKVDTECWAGPISADYAQGGKIDLVITPTAKVPRILIENKIFARDQKCQLLRYSNFDKNAVLLYLTLCGGEASQDSTSNQKDSITAGADYLPISYRDHIIGWLETCAKEASAKPLVRETIVQYAHLIRKLTNQNSSKLMEEEIVTKALSSKESLLTFDALLGARVAVRQKILSRIDEDLKHLAKRLGLDDSKSTICLAQNEDLVFIDPTLSDHNLCIAFSSEGGWYYGLCRINLNDPRPAEEHAHKLRTNLGSEEPTIPCPAWRYWIGFENWTNDFEKLAVFYDFQPSAAVGQSNRETSLTREVEERIKELQSVAKRVFTEKPIISPL